VKRRQRAAIETNTGDERHRREGEAAMVESIDTRERKPIEAWCKCLSECEVTRSDEGPSHEARRAETGTGKTGAEAAAREAAHPATREAAHPATSHVHPTTSESATTHAGIGCG
jgi:hypothetical protein